MEPWILLCFLRFTFLVSFYLLTTLYLPSMNNYDLTTSFLLLSIISIPSSHFHRAYVVFYQFLFSFSLAWNVYSNDAPLCVIMYDDRDRPTKISGLAGPIFECSAVVTITMYCIILYIHENYTVLRACIVQCVQS
ncbi:uncharacterized protein GGS25DRAFT_145034 [Hypoxylon fragiforme]|uniref:uncharacterized protein n=1 Tax=Hypoxylon fragiforme TaxID=63214 RepID=UPI0020C65061|nr:uncharacterized protein GGS25DRAFT_145034 [Hypoxylon fragiforme]KAI2612987.1 hypothetical protein GGS25DRAFT_145034 [Hypoxylon fragiforme]